MCKIFSVGGNAESTTGHLALLFCLASLAGCADIRQHWSDSFSRLWQHNTAQVAKHGPEVATGVAVAAAGTAIDSATDQAIYGHESPRERQERENEEFFDDDNRQN